VLPLAKGRGYQSEADQDHKHRQCPTEEVSESVGEVERLRRDEKQQAESDQ
jgi:hypothetical protein